jgi:hypothetical protein
VSAQPGRFGSTVRANSREDMLGLMYKAFKQPIDSLFLLLAADFFLDTAILTF